MRKTLIIFISCLTTANAGVKDELQHMLNTLNYSSNVSNGAAYTDQTGGYYTGGSIFARSPVKNANVLSLSMPSLQTGCGGIDLYTGGFSFISSEQFSQMLRTIGSSATSYAFSLALQTITPQIKSVLDELFAKMQDINNLNINSCQAAATLVGGVWPRTEASSQQLCQSMGSNFGTFSDWAQARQECGSGNKAHSVNSQKKSGFEDVLNEEFNVAWKAIQKSPLLKGDRELAEFFMSISGSIISRISARSHRMTRGKDRKQSDSSGIERFHLPPLALSDGLLSSLLNGGEQAEVYHCDDIAEDKCLKPTKKKLSIDIKNSLTNKVEVLIDAIVEKLKTDDSALTPQEQALVNSTQIPLLRMITVEMMFKAGGSPTNTKQYVDAIAHDLLLRYLEDVLELINQNLTQLQQVQMDDSIVKDFKKDIAHVRKKIFERRNGVYQHMLTTLKIIEQTQQIEKKMQSMFVTYSRGEL